MSYKKCGVRLVLFRADSLWLKCAEISPDRVPLDYVNLLLANHALVNLFVEVLVLILLFQLAHCRVFLVDLKHEVFKLGGVV